MAVDERNHVKVSNVDWLSFARLAGAAISRVLSPADPDGNRVGCQRG